MPFFSIFNCFPHFIVKPSFIAVYEFKLIDKFNEIFQSIINLVIHICPHTFILSD